VGAQGAAHVARPGSVGGLEPAGGAFPHAGGRGMAGATPRDPPGIVRPARPPEVPLRTMYLINIVRNCTITYPIRISGMGEDLWIVGQTNAKGGANLRACSAEPFFILFVNGTKKGVRGGE
jgi:hypothetical protein